MTTEQGKPLDICTSEERTAADAVREIADLTLPPFLTPPGEHKGCYWIRGADGGYSRINADRKPSDYRAETVPGIVSLIRLFAETRRVDVFVSSERVVAIPGEALGLLDRATLELKATEQMNCLEFDGLVGVGQQELVLKLSTLFREQVEPHSFLPLVRNLRWKNNEDGKAQVRHDGGSYGMDVELAVAGLEKGESVPETVVFTPSVFTNAIKPSNQLGSTIECAVTADPSQKKFSIKPLPDQIALAFEHARNGIAKYIEAAFKDVAAKNKVVVHQDAIA